jgi:hypothetical protein
VYVHEFQHRLRFAIFTTHTTILAQHQLTLSRTRTPPPLDTQLTILLSYCLRLFAACEMVRGPAVMGLFGKSGLQGPPTRVALLLRDIQLRLSQWPPPIHNMGHVAGPGRTLMPGNNAGLSRTRAIEPRYRPPGQRVKNKHSTALTAKTINNPVYEIAIIAP